MQAPAGSDQCPMNHVGVKLLQSSGACRKEAQFGQWHSCREDEEPTRLFWLDQRLHKAAALLNSTAQLSSVWLFYIFVQAGLQTLTVVCTLMLLATSTPPGWPLVWVPVKNCSA